MKKIDKTKDIVDLFLFGRKRRELLNEISDQLKYGRKPLIMYTPNAEQLVQAYHDPGFLEVIQRADLLIPDGSGVVFASRWQGQHPLTEWIPGVDVVEFIIKEASRRHLTVLIIGGRGYGGLRVKGQVINELDQDKNKKINPMIKDSKSSSSEIADREKQSLIWWTEGYQDVTKPTADEKRAVERIVAKIKPAAILVAFGAPYQEMWVDESLDLIDESQTRLVMVVGGSLDLLIGRLKRAPLWMRQLGLEWLFRLIQEPWRWKRQIRLISFVWLILRGKIKISTEPKWSN